MSNAWAWLAPHLEGAPKQLRDCMRVAVEQSNGDSVHAQLANAATMCLRAAARRSSEKRAALDLLSADALLTHACAAAAEAGSAELARFTTHYDASYFQEILDE